MKKTYGMNPSQEEDKPKLKVKKPTWNFTKPEKVTGAQLQDSFDTWREKRRDKHETTPSSVIQRRRRRVLCGVLGAAVLAVMITGQVSTTAHEHTAAARADQIDQLSADVAGGSPQAQPISAKDIQKINEQATTAANKVRDTQNGFAPLAVAANKDVLSAKGNGAPTKAMIELIDHRKDSASLWDSESFVASDKDIYAFTTEPYLDQGKIDPRLPWYIRYDGKQASAAGDYSWRVESVSPDLDHSAMAQVVWICADKDGTTLAWASATFDSAKGTFSDLTLVTTRAGQKHAQQTGQTPAVTVPDTSDQKKETKDSKNSEAKDAKKDSSKKKDAKSSKPKKKSDAKKKSSKDTKSTKDSGKKSGGK